MSVIASKVANALFEGDSVQVRDLKVVPGQDAVPGVVEVFRRAYGGVWVGGRATLTATSLVFAPNALNRAVQHGLRTLEVDLRTVEGVDDLPGFFTKIIAVRVGTPVGTEVLKLRCYGAPAFAAQIRAAVAAARG